MTATVFVATKLTNHWTNCNEHLMYQILCTSN